MQPLADAIPLLKAAGPEAAADVADAAERFSLPGGHTLFRAGEPADALHFVVAGALVVVRPGPHGDELIGYIRAGEPVGEMALVSGGDHTLSVYALRDSALIRIKRADYEQLWRKHPALLQNLARQMLARARQPRPDLHAAPPRVFALIALTPAVPIDRIAATLCEHITGLGLKCATLTKADAEQPITYFETIEARHDAVLFEARPEDADWFRLAVRQADRLWLFVPGAAQPSSPLTLIPDDQTVMRRLRLVDVVSFEDGAAPAPPNAKEWKAAVGAQRFFRWRTNADAARIARTMAGRSVGLVLSGGGARAYAHIGVVQALREARVPIDLAGGTSMGAIIAAGVALGWSDAEMRERITDAFVTSNPLGDHHLPVVALTRGKLVEQRLIKHFGDTPIDDMQLPYFCVSTDLVSSTTRVHRDGLLREALRASIALPGMLPPVASGDSLLVDGAVLNNLPVDVMKTLHHGFTIGVDVALRGSIDPKDFVNPPSFLPWIMRHGFKAPPPIVSLLMRTATIGIENFVNHQTADLLIEPELGDVEIRDWKAYDKAVAAGYEAAKKALSSEAAAKLPRI